MLCIYFMISNRKQNSHIVSLIHKNYSIPIIHIKTISSGKMPLELMNSQLLMVLKIFKLLNFQSGFFLEYILKRGKLPCKSRGVKNIHTKDSNQKTFLQAL